MRSRSLWRDRDFTIFWLMQVLSVAGDSFSYIALPLLVLDATGSVAQMGLLTGVSGAAALVTGIFAGVAADRLDRRRLMIGADVVRTILYATIPIVWLAGPQLWVLYVIAPLGAAVGQVYQVTYVAAVPSLVDRDRITEANSRLFGAAAAAGIAGPMLAGLVSAAWGPATAIGVDAATFAISAAGLCFVRLRRVDRPEKAVSWREFVVGAQFLWRHPVLRALTIVLSAALFLTFGLIDLFIYHLEHDLRQSDATVGYVVAAGAVGTVVAAMIVPRARRALGFGACFLGSMGLGGLAVAALGLGAGLPVVATLITVFMFCTAISGICSMSLRQEVTPDHLLGKVTAAFWTIHYAPGPIGAALLTAGAARFGTVAIFATAGLSAAVVAAAGAFTSVRQRRPEAQSTGRPVGPSPRTSV